MSPLFPAAWFTAIRDESSGELPLVDFQNIVTRFSGFAPSKGGDEIAEYLAGRMREYALDEVAIEGFPADGKSFVWAFITEPAWDGERGVLRMVKPRVERLADFAVHRIVLGRFSTSAEVTADLVDIGSGTRPEDYAGKDVRGKLVLASGAPGAAHAQAVWAHGAAGVIWFRTTDALNGPHLISNASIVPWSGPRGEPPGFTFSLSFTAGMELRRILQRGERVVLSASVKATTGPGEYKQVTAAIPGSEPSLREVWIKAHDNYRNTGGGNNLTGVGATIEIARVLRKLTGNGTLPRPGRTIRFLWSAEHYGSTYQFYKHPDRLGRVLALLNVDMAGFHQERAKAVFNLYRLPHSLPHFLSDVCQEFLESVGNANTITLAERGMDMSEGPAPIYAPTGSRDQMHYSIQDFWGPSDHEDVVEGSLAVPAVLYNDWPDIYLGTQEDDLDKVDPTQMRRAVVTVAATAYYLASAGADDIPRLAPVIVDNAQARLARDTRRAFALIGGTAAGTLATQYREGSNVLSQSLKRELATLATLPQLGQGPNVDAALARGRKQIEALHAANLAAFRDRVAGVAADLRVTLHEPAPGAGEHRLAGIVPARNTAIRGPVNIFRPEYGAVWLAQKTGDEAYLSTLAIAKNSRYVAYEALNFVDGKRSLLDIRDAVSAEYGPIDAADVEQYFRFLERAGVVSLKQESRPKN